jgi:hypothetical protein
MIGTSPRVLISALLTTSVLLCAPGCGSIGASERTTAEVESLLISTISDTAPIAASTDWRMNSGRPAPAPCGDQTVTKFAWSITTDRGPDPAIDARRVYEYWTGLGMKTRLVEKPIPAVYARGGNIRTVAFSTGPALHSISGTSECAPGDSAELEGRPRMSRTAAEARS